MLREVRYGSFERRITLPSGINTDDLHAAFENGMLIISAPIKEERKATKGPPHLLLFQLSAYSTI